MFREYLDLPRDVYILAVGTLVNRCGSFLMFFLTIYLTSSLGFDEQFATWTMGVFGVGSLVASLVGGYLVDRVGRKAIMLFSLWASVVVLLFFGSLNTKVEIITGVALFSMVSEMYRPAAMAMVADVCPSKKRGIAFGLIFLAINLGSGIAGLIGGFLSTFSFKSLFWADAVTTALYAILITFTLRETLFLSKEEEKGDTLKTTNFFSFVLRDKSFLLFCFGSLCLGLVYIQSWSSLPLYLRRIGFDARDYGTMISINPFLIVAFQIPITNLVLRYSRGWMMVLATFIVAVGFGLTGLHTSALWISTTIVIWTIGEMIQSPLGPAIVSDLAPPRFRGRYMGFYAMTFSGANIVGAPLGGFVLTQYGGSQLWSGSFVLALFSSICFLVIIKKIAVKKLIA